MLRLTNDFMGVCVAVQKMLRNRRDDFYTCVYLCVFSAFRCLFHRVCVIRRCMTVAAGKKMLFAHPSPDREILLKCYSCISTGMPVVIMLKLTLDIRLFSMLKY